MTALPEGSAAPDSDASLLARVRSGDRKAFGVLWDRHHGAGLAAARAVTSAFDAEDLVSEAFVRVMKAIENGNGPDAAFRPYLVTTVRSVAARWGAQPAELTPEELEVVDPATSDEAFSEQFDQSLTVQAFNTLPQRWQEVLWYTEAEQLPPREVAALIGIKANAVSALAKRAREGLRHAWVAAHVASVPEDSECRWVIDRLAAQTRKSLPAREQDRLDAHLDDCDRCPLAAEEMTAASRRLGVLILIGFLGAGSATAYGTLLKPVAATAATLGGGAGVVGWLAKPSAARNLTLGGGTAVVAGVVAVSVAFAATGAGRDAPRPAAAAASASSAAAGSGPGGGAVAAPATAAAPQPRSPSPSAPAAPSQPVAPVTQIAPAGSPSPSSAPAPKRSSTPAPSSTPTSTPTPAARPLTVTSVDTGTDNEFYPIISGTGDPKATITIVPSSQPNPSVPVSTTVTVAANGTYVTPQLDWITSPSAGEELTLTQITASGAKTSLSENVTVEAAPTVTLTEVLGVPVSAEVTGDPAATNVDVESLDGDQDLAAGNESDVPLIAGLAIVSLPTNTTVEIARYSNSSGRFGPWS